MTMAMEEDRETDEPTFREATYGGESVVLENRFLKLVMHRRVNGWGFGELYGPDESGCMDNHLAVLEHLAEVDIVGQEYALRLDADTYEKRELPGGEELVFEVKMQLPQGPWMAWDCYRAIRGTVTIRLMRDEPWIGYSLFAKPDFTLRYRSLRGPWLRVDAGRTDAIFPGLEWLIEDEWSSGTDHMPHSFAARITPHPRRVTSPVMTVSRNGLAIGLSWGPAQDAPRMDDIQPVFASPNFIDRKDGHLMGLMLPGCASGLEENRLTAEPPPHMPKSGLRMSAQIGVVPGKSLDMLVAWLNRHGMPDPGPPRIEMDEALRRIAEAYNTHLWTEGEGFLRSWHLAPVQPFMDVRWEERIDVAKRVPRVVERFIEMNGDSTLAGELAKKAEWCQKQANLTRRDKKNRIGARFDLFEWFSDEELRALGQSILTTQTEAGDFPFDPSGRHRAEHLNAAAAWKPLGQPGESCLNLCMSSGLLLLLIGNCLEDETLTDAGGKTLEFAMPMERPEGGDWWETSLHAPSLLAAGYAALAYHTGYALLGDERYLRRAIHFIRALLPFTTLWETASVKMLYQPKPLFGATAWHAMDWTTRHIMWQILMVFDLSDELGVDWTSVDPDVDWATFQRGITVAGIRWLVDHTDSAWMARCEDERCDVTDQIMQDVRRGVYDMMLPDNFDPVGNTYGGIGINIPPDTLGANILYATSR